MEIKSITVTNFKSFERLEVELGKFNVLIGANASGKSNFIQIFKFLKDIANFGLNNAVSMQGGVEYIRNINIGASENLSVKIVSDKEFNLFLPIEKTKEGLIAIRPSEITYEFALKLNKRGPGFKIAEDKLTEKGKLVRLERQKRKIEEKEIPGQGKLIKSCINGRVKLNLYKESEEIPIEKGDIYPPFLREKLPPNTLLLQTPFFFVSSLEEIFSGISIYDFDPKLPKKATPITGKAELEEDGSNLSIILKNIIENKEGRRKFFNLVKELLPFIGNLGVAKLADKSLLFKLQELYSEQYLPAFLISDGTINITALIVALYFEEKPLSIIEEPERNIHPHLISKLMDMMKDASKEKQVIITTHNPEIVKYAGLDNILLISRDEKGFSTISRPANKEGVETFLKNEIGIEELYVQNLLEV